MTEQRALQAVSEGEDARQAASERLEELKARITSRQRLLQEEQVGASSSFSPFPVWLIQLERQENSF